MQPIKQVPPFPVQKDVPPAPQPWWTSRPAPGITPKERKRAQ